MSNMQMRESIVVDLPNPKGMGRFEAWRLKHRKLPDEFFHEQKGAYVGDGDWTVGREFLTQEGRKVTVLTQSLVFMGFNSVVQYSNGAIRHNSYIDFLYEIA